MLTGAGFLDEAHAAMHLDAQRSNLDAQFGGPAFNHRDQHINPRLLDLAHR